MLELAGNFHTFTDKQNLCTKENLHFLSKVEKLGAEIHSFHISVSLDFVSRLEKCKEVSKGKEKHLWLKKKIKT